MDEDFMLLMAVVLTECVRLNGGPIEISRALVESFDPYANRVQITPSELGDKFVISAYSGEIIEGEVVGTTD